MSYDTLRSNDVIRARYLAVMTPRRRVATWSVHSGFIYSASWDGFPTPTKLEFNGVEMTEVDTVSDIITASQWAYDAATDTLYFREPQSGDPDDGMPVFEYKLFVCTDGGDSNWYSTPDDDTTEQVHFEPVIRTAPSIKASVTDTLFGFLPVQSSSMSLSNSEHWLEKHLHDSSFSQSSVAIYHALGDDLDVDNLRKIYDGLISDYNYGDDVVTFTMKDRFDEFSNEYRNPTKNFYGTDDFPNLNPAFVGRPIRYVYGYVQGFVPVNVSYVVENPTTSDNRTWCLVNETTGISDVSRTVGNGSTGTRTYANFVEGFQVGDTVWLDRASGSDAYVIVTAVSLSPAYIEHEDIVTPMTSGDTIKRSFCSRVTIISQNAAYVARFGRDYTTTHTLAGSTCSGIVFSSSLEANLSMAATLNGADTVICTVYGRANDLTANALTFGANDPDSNNLANPVMVIYDLLKARVGIPESRLNLTELASLYAATTGEGIGLAIPESSSGGFPTYKRLILDILQTSLIKIFLDNDNKWTLRAAGPMGTSTKTVDVQELFGGYDVQFSHSDMVSDVLVEYLARERSEDPFNSDSPVSQVTAVSNYAKYAHKIQKQKTFKSLHFREADAQVLADRLSYVFGDRAATYKFKTTARFFDSEINDPVTIETEKLPGFELATDTTRSRDLNVVTITKTLRDVTIEAEDQKGIEDNSALW